MKIVMDDFMNVKVVYTGKPISIKSTLATATSGGQGVTMLGSSEGSEATTEEPTTVEEGEATTGAEDSSQIGEEATEGMDNGENGEGGGVPAGNGDMAADGGMADGGILLGDGGMMEGGEMGTGDTGVKDPILSSWPFVIGISAATLAVSIVIGILLAKLKIKKGFDLYED